MGRLTNIFILDACALIALLGNEPGADKINNFMRRADDKDILLKINQINLLETYYDLVKVYDQNKANKILKKLKEYPMEIIIGLTEETFKEAGRLKIQYKIPFGDSIAAAECIVGRATLITSDRTDFEKLEKHEKIKIEWFR